MKIGIGGKILILGLLLLIIIVFILNSITPAPQIQNNRFYGEFDFDLKKGMEYPLNFPPGTQNVYFNWYMTTVETLDITIENSTDPLTMYPYHIISSNPDQRIIYNMDPNKEYTIIANPSCADIHLVVGYNGVKNR